ncbi:hypothetical protein U9M48_010744 [Paspalum notatum var. saurae]|uniref:DUF4283 domain-containing protein n=1 Tax=Paspalum notatum var. saurae TaxID=547442 RepID=A0AAQ3WGU1_PASNO
MRTSYLIKLRSATTAASLWSPFPPACAWTVVRDHGCEVEYVCLMQLIPKARSKMQTHDFYRAEALLIRPPAARCCCSSPRVAARCCCRLLRAAAAAARRTLLLLLLRAAAWCCSPPACGSPRAAAARRRLPLSVASQIQLSDSPPAVPARPLRGAARLLPRRRFRPRAPADAALRPCHHVHVLQALNCGDAEMTRGTGKFWDPDSDPDCEELGDADVLAQPHRRSASSQVPRHTAAAPPGNGSASTPPSQTRRKAHRRSTPPSPGRVLPPWKKLWKGPLPPPRTTPETTLGDILIPALRKASSEVSGSVGVGHGDPESTRVQFWKQPDPSHTARVEPIRTASTPVIGKPKRRLFNPTLVSTITTSVSRSYLDVLMAGGHRGRDRGRDPPGRGFAPGRRQRDRGGQGGASATAGAGVPGNGQGGRGTGGAVPRGGNSGAARRGAQVSFGSGAGQGDPSGNQTADPVDGQVSGGGGGRGRGRGAAGAAVNSVPAVEPSVEPAGQAGDQRVEQGNQKRKRREPSVKLVCTICTEEHFTNQCPQLRGPKPSVAYCGAAEDGIGFFQIQAARTNHIVSPVLTSAAALITVEEGSISSELLQSELARIIPVQWNWIVQEHGDKSFVVPFPCKEELDRMVAIRRITTKNKEGVLIFDEFDDDIKPIKVLDQVWVTVTKVPRVLRSFLPLWAVGSIIGATQKVDVNHLRLTGEVRILVAVFNAKQIPKHADVCVNRSIYRIFFKADEALRDDSFNPDEGGDDDNNDLGGSEDHEMEDAPDATQPPAPGNNNKNNGTEKSPTSTAHDLPQKQAALIDGALDIQCERLLEEISIKVMVEPDYGVERKGYSPLSEVELAAYNDLVASPNKVHPSTISLQSRTELPEVESLADALGDSAGAGASSSPSNPVDADAQLPAGPAAAAEVESSAGEGTLESCDDSTVSLQHGAGEVVLPPSVPGIEELPATRTMAKGGNFMEEATLKQTTLRRSLRSKAMADEHTLQKTSRMAAKKNLESPGYLQGNLQRDEQAKSVLSLMSKNIEMIALQLSNGGWKHIYHNV